MLNIPHPPPPSHPTPPHTTPHHTTQHILSLSTVACAFVRGHNHHRNPQVTKLREYLLIADDGQLALGTHSAMPAEPYPGASATAQYYSNEAVDRECIALKQRSLLRLLDPSSTSPCSFGIGSGCSLLPTSVTSVRTVICLVKPKEDDTLWLLVPSFSLFKADEVGVAMVNAALACTTKPEPKPYYGTKVKQIKEMYSKYVPPEYVPDQFELATSGTSGLLRASVISLMRTPEDNAATAERATAAAAAGQAAEGAAAPAPATAASAKRRWCQAHDDKKLVAAEPLQCLPHWLAAVEQGVEAGVGRHVLRL